MNTPDFVVAIPARYGSTRLPAKALRLIAGEPMIVHVARRAAEAGAREVVVATDDARIAEALAPLGVKVCMTSASHTSGTDRLAECAQQLDWPDDTIVVNLQGDEPQAPPAAIRAAAQALADSGAHIATLAQPIDSTDELFDPNCVKLVRDGNGLALYFSRAPIPWHRDAFARDRITLPTGHTWLRHIGLYAYRVAQLRAFAAMAPGTLEQIESLEQLRALEAGWRIAAVLSPEAFPAGVDTEADLRRVEREMAAR